MKVKLAWIMAVIFLSISFGQTLPLKCQSKETLADGRYQIAVKLYHATKEEVSVGNGAVKEKGMLIVKNGKATLHLEMQAMNISGMTGYLSELNTLAQVEFNAYQFPSKYVKVPAKVLSVHDVVDNYNDSLSTDENCKGVKYPKKLSIPVVLQQEYTWVQMYVPVMGAMGFGEQLARVKLDYSSCTALESVSRSELLELITGLEEKTASHYTESSFQMFIEQLHRARQVAEEEESDKKALEAAYYDLLEVVEKLQLKSISADSQPSPLPTSTLLPTSTPIAKPVQSPVKEEETLDKDQLPDGKYQVSVQLWHATMDKESMGNAAVIPNGLIEVKKGKYTMTVATTQMTVGTITSCLRALWVKQADGTYKAAKIVEYNNPNKQPSAFSFTMPVKEEYLDVKIDPQIEIMGSEPLDARLKIDWNTLKAVSSQTIIEGGTTQKPTSSVTPPVASAIPSVDGNIQSSSSESSSTSKEQLDSGEIQDTKEQFVDKEPQEDNEVSADWNEDNRKEQKAPVLSRIEHLKLVVAMAVSITVIGVVLTAFAGVTAYVVYKKLREV